MVNRFEMNEALKSRLLGAENAEQAAEVGDPAALIAQAQEIAVEDEIGRQHQRIHTAEEIRKQRRDPEQEPIDAHSVSPF